MQRIYPTEQEISFILQFRRLPKEQAATITQIVETLAAQTRREPHLSLVLKLPTPQHHRV